MTVHIVRGTKKLLNGDTVTADYGVFSSEELANEAIKRVKVFNKKEHDPGWEYLVQHWWVQSELGNPPLGEKVLSVEDAPRYVMSVVDQANLDLELSYFQTQEEAREAMWKSVLALSCYESKEEAIQAAENNDCITVSDDGVIIWEDGDITSTIVWGIEKIPEAVRSSKGGMAA